MFEKDAEEYAKETFVEEVRPTARNAFKDGAEFGYNKANEWHDLRKDPSDLPKKELWNKQLLLLVDRNGLSPCFVVGYYEESEVLEDYEKNWGWYNIAENVAFEFIDNEISVLKWKEIE